MRRRLFFFIERLNITPGERRFVMSAAILFATVTLININFNRNQIFGSSYYKPLVKEYYRKIHLAERRDSLQKLKYYTIPERVSTKAARVPFNKNNVPMGTKPISSVKKNSHKKGLISINLANKRALTTLPGIGPKTAQKIISYRKQNGRFPTLESLMEVKGIGKKKFEKIKPFIRLNEP